MTPPTPPPPTVDGDPHFVARVQGTPYPLCFTLDGRPGDTLQLLTDPSLGEDTHLTPTNLWGIPQRPLNGGGVTPFSPS